MPITKNPKQPNQAQDYATYAHVLKGIASATALSEFPRIIVMSGPSDFLRSSAMAALRAKWLKLDPNEPQSVEAQSLDHATFRSLWSQVSLLEPQILYLLKRCDKHSKLAVWLKDIKESTHIKSHITFDFSEKIPAELNRQLIRLQAVFVPCVEPSSPNECGRIAAQLAKREGLVLADDAIRLLLDSMGPDLGKLSNEIQKIAMVFHGRTTPLRSADISPIVGALREDHVFELFNLLRNRQRAKAQLLIDHLLERGEKAIALIGILSRFSRELILRSPIQGTRGLRLCANADILLKSSRSSEALLLGSIVDALID